MEQENWIPAAGFSKYEVSTLGRLRRAVTSKGTWAGRVIAGYPEKQRGGYLRTNLQTDEIRQVKVRINRLICESFHGPAPSPKHEAAHRNGNRTDNRPANLKWATGTENAADKLEHGTQAKGEGHGMSKLRSADIVSIRSQAERGIPHHAIAEQFEVTQTCVSQVVSGKTWRHVG